MNSVQNQSSGWWFGTWMLFPHISGIIIPTDFFFRGVAIPPTWVDWWLVHGFYYLAWKKWRICQNPRRRDPVPNSIDWFKGKQYRKIPHFMAKSLIKTTQDSMDWDFDIWASTAQMLLLLGSFFFFSFLGLSGCKCSKSSWSKANVGQTIINHVGMVSIPPIVVYFCFTYVRHVFVDSSELTPSMWGPQTL